MRPDLCSGFAARPSCEAMPFSFIHRTEGHAGIAEDDSLGIEVNRSPRRRFEVVRPDEQMVKFSIEGLEGKLPRLFEKKGSALLLFGCAVRPFVYEVHFAEPSNNLGCRVAFRTFHKQRSKECGARGCVCKIGAHLYSTSRGLATYPSSRLYVSESTAWHVPMTILGR